MGRLATSVPLEQHKPSGTKGRGGTLLYSINLTPESSAEKNRVEETTRIPLLWK